MVGVRVGQSVGNADGESVGANDGENERRSSVSFDGTAVGVCKRKYALARNTARPLTPAYTAHRGYVVCGECRCLLAYRCVRWRARKHVCARVC